MLKRFLKNGWCQFPFDSELYGWVENTLPAAREAVALPENKKWFRYQNTWFAGVNVLPNDASGAVKKGSGLVGTAADFVRNELAVTDIKWDKAQISVCYPGYPKPVKTESTAVFQYRLKRDAAHIDGLLREGEQRKRFLREHHAFILGIPLAEYSQAAAPPVVWEGSHKIAREVFRKIFNGKTSQYWRNVDVTEGYKLLRQRIFEQCKRVEIHAKPGEAYLIHRLALHGMGQWENEPPSTKDGRMICYFRPKIRSTSRWLNDL